MNWMLLPYRRYAEFSGRSRRREYWMFALFYFLVLVALNAAFGTNEVQRGAGTFVYGSRLVGAGNWVGGLFWLASLIPSLAVSVRRLHDQDRTGWLLLLMFIPFLGWFALLVLMCLEGTRGPNRFGPDPKNPVPSDVFA
ncbi:DUF805 domain-containing protein [Novosphingobium olei]|uniref:DUF805 domain-containing protein n=1 Tax=Novosphingobium olei TaxID=2728851 RepID=A0A7Y0BNV7_9SPHN|nr:DUF805 domain-containing protein [Novosphingobium olei]NML93927.1 DUF805 domain-containing protein [Novosphingobium olei]BEV01111.1 DUF805 domain-containing protein [Novosphingobium olei]